ncbi:MAG: hypothetical protein L6R40_007123 [Gallowayella cf. fulva]|nr:MAG: hypothetical protein L6R40_007123 [Xanthomendoza cf. fulva]
MARHSSSLDTNYQTTLHQHLFFGHQASATMSPGSIYYLPPLASIPASQWPKLASIHQGIFNHPTVIISTDPWRSTATILIMTTFGGKPLSSKPQRHQSRYVPVFPNEPHPLNGSILYLDTDWALPKAGYIDTKQILTIPTSILQPLFDQLTGQHFRLRAASRAEVLEIVCRPRGSRSSSLSSSRSLSSSPSAPARPSIYYTPQILLQLRTKTPALDATLPLLLSRLQTPEFNLLHKRSPSPPSSPTSTTITTKPTPWRPSRFAPRNSNNNTIRRPATVR